MPIILATTNAHLNGLVQCEEQTVAALGGGAHPQEEPWTRETFLHFRSLGYKAHIWVPSGGNTVMGGIVDKVETIRGEKWLRIIKACVRVQALPAGDDREKAILRAAKAAIQEAMPDGISGTFMYVYQGNTRLINFLDRTFTAAVTRETEMGNVVYAFRLQPGTPELEAATSGLSD